MLLAQPQRRSRVRVGFAGAHALLIVEYITPAAGLQPGVGTHQSPRTHTSLGQPPSIFSGRFPSTFTTRSHGVPQVPHRPSATMASRMSLPSPWSNTMVPKVSAPHSIVPAARNGSTWGMVPVQCNHDATELHPESVIVSVWRPRDRKCRRAPWLFGRAG